MKITNIEQIEDFMAVVNSCSGKVKLRSPDGDVYNLRSKFSQYVAIGALLGEHGDELEIFCDNAIDEFKFYQFFAKHEEVL